MTVPVNEHPAGSLALTLMGEPVVLLAERALWLPERDTLIVADLHWGKAAAFRAAFVPIPTGTTNNDLTRLTSALALTSASQLIVLGDLLHARAGRQAGTLDVIGAWRAHHPHVHITLVRGNHDTRAGDPPASLHIECVDEPLRIGPFLGVHDPLQGASPYGYVLGGHLHPCVSVHGRGRQHVRLNCFVFGPHVGVLPAFSSFTGGGMYERDERDTLYGIADGTVLRIG